MKIKYVIGAVVLLLLILQLFPSNTSNPPVTAALKANPEVMKILKQSCYDCHSNETYWPWYSRVAPISYFVSNHVEDGRKHLNFSDWEKFDDDKKGKLSKEIIEEIEEGNMPLSNYKLLHPVADLSDSDLKMLKAWFGGKQ